MHHSLSAQKLCESAFYGGYTSLVIEAHYFNYGGDLECLNHYCCEILFVNTHECLLEILYKTEGAYSLGALGSKYFIYWIE